ncbi:hypothetical protein ACVWYG_003956 [Pedobacter sp. UYEF25]
MGGIKQQSAFYLFFEVLLNVPTCAVKKLILMRKGLEMLFR